jgi:hypothetical protein
VVRELDRNLSPPWFGLPVEKNSPLLVSTPRNLSTGTATVLALFVPASAATRIGVSEMGTQPLATAGAKLTWEIILLQSPATAPEKKLLVVW